MKKIFKILLSASLLLSPSWALADTSSNNGAATLNAAQFKQAMDNAIESQKNKITSLKSVVFNLNAPVVAGADKQLVDATVILEVKQNLYDKFIDNPINQDPQFQAYILRVMNQSVITENDLNELQAAVNAAHARQKQ